jgi:branched-subunit amino acid transport protein
VTSATTVWLTIGLLALITIAIKAVGPITLGNRTLSPPVAAVVALLAPPLLTALVLVETVGDGEGGFSLDARLGGLAAAGIALALKLPTLAVVVIAAVATAALRALA